jgi:hypothetical protein
VSESPERDATPRPTSPAEPDDGPFAAKDDAARPLPPITPADVSSASRSCLAILILGTAILLVLCVAIAFRTVL